MGGWNNRSFCFESNSVKSSLKCLLKFQVRNPLGLLFCTLISENEGLAKLRSVSNLRKISGPAHLSFFSVDFSFFSVCHLSFFQIYTINMKKIQVTNWKKIQVYWKKIQVCRTWNFSKVWSRPQFLKTLIFRNQGAE